MSAALQKLAGAPIRRYQSSVAALCCWNGSLPFGQVNRFMGGDGHAAAGRPTTLMNRIIAEWPLRVFAGKRCERRRTGPPYFRQHARSGLD